ncbi:MAG TPA: MMPL family transporter [Myxococcota bacterium]|nr:MMPL family transporter [Myxococcota bacterium]HRY94007.1 MMPL family transporter [Myxococcota bacterium]
MSDSRFAKLVERYVLFLERRAGWVLLVGLALAILGGLSASRFTLRTDLAELLPQDEPSIQDLKRASARVGGISSYFLTVVSGPDFEANRRFVDALVARFRGLPKDLVVDLRYGVHEEKEFYSKYKHLYADLEDLEKINDRLKAKIRYERIKNNPVLNLDLDGEELEPVEFDLQDIRDKYEQKGSSYNRYQEGYLTGEEGRLAVIMMYPPANSTGVDLGRRMLREIRAAAAEVCHGGALTEGLDPGAVLASECAARFGQGAEVNFLGSMVTAILEQDAIINDIILVTAICVSLNMLLLLLYFRTWRSVPIIGTSLAMGTVITFGVSIYIVEFLNTSTAFLASIIVGNGINFGIIQLARYLEERRAGRGMHEALTTAMRFTSISTVTAALAASIAYGALIITHFRGFTGFGYMGGLGMLINWVAAFTLQPALLVLAERLRPQRFAASPSRSPAERLGRPVARLLARSGLGLHLVAFGSAAACCALTWQLVQDPFEYDFRKLRNQAARNSKLAELDRRVGAIFPQRLDPAFVLADRPDQVPLIQAELQRNNHEGPHQKLFDDFKSIYSYLPKDQDKKIEVLRKINKQLSASTLSWLSDEDREELDKYRPPEDLQPLGIEDLPGSMLRLFTELDGRKGLVVLLYPRREGRSIWDGHFLTELSQASRLIRLPDGSQVRSAGVGTVFADMIRAMERDGPRAVAASLLGVMLLMILIYRRWRPVALMGYVLFYGVVWTTGPLVLLGERLNFLNFIALPITFGIGLDYAVNLYTRYRLEGDGSMERALVNTGGAVAMCSMTTLIGYSSLLIADNRALFSFGVLSILGEFASLGAALVMIPSTMALVERRKRRLEAQRSRGVS